jgi:hypothetical protein
VAATANVPNLTFAWRPWKMIGLIRLRLPAGLAALLVTGCATLDQADPVLSKYPGIKTEITNYYEDKAVEEDWTCNEVDMQGIEKIQII